LLLDRAERARMLRGEPFRLFGKMRDCGLLDVIGRCLHELGLPARRRAFPPGKIKIRQREVGLKRARCRVQSRPPHAYRWRPRPDYLQTFRKPWLGAPHTGNRGEPRPHENRPQAQKSTHASPYLSKSRPDPLPRSAATIQAGQALIKTPKAPKIWSRRCCR